MRILGEQRERRREIRVSEGCSDGEVINGWRFPIKFISSIKYNYSQMNETWQRSLKLHHKHYYYGQPSIDIQELHRALSVLPESKKNRFPMHAIRNKREENEKAEDDLASFQDLNQRIQRTLKDPKDSLFMEAYFELADEDGDGFINYDQLRRVAHELGRHCMEEKTFLAMAEKLSQDGVKFSKAECMDILRNYL